MQLAWIPLHYPCVGMKGTKGPRALNEIFLGFFPFRTTPNAPGDNLGAVELVSHTEKILLY